MLVSTAAVAADIPARTSPLPPTVTRVQQSQPFFVGIHVGVATPYNGDRLFETDNVRTNLRGGFEFSPYSRVEGNYEYNWNDNSNLRSHTVTTNLIGQYRFGSVVPYILVGGGYRWSNFKNEPVYNVGGGVRYELTTIFEVDARYRYVTDRNQIRDENVFTLGLNFRF
jgi:opacity protein-like surface antigen